MDRGVSAMHCSAVMQACPLNDTKRPMRHPETPPASHARIMGSTQDLQESPNGEDISTKSRVRAEAGAGGAPRRYDPGLTPSEIRLHSATQVEEKSS